MTTPSQPDSVGGDHAHGAPTLPPSLPPSQPPPSHQPPQPAEILATSGVAAPVLPAARSIAPAAPAAPIEFDAKAMVESQKHSVQNPAYGGLPKATPESVAAAKALRAKAQRKRRRNKAFGWFVALMMLGGIGVAGWYAYQAYQDDQEQLDADRAAAQADGSAGAPGPLTPLGNQQDVIDVLGDVNSGGATPSAGGLLDIVDDAQAAVDDVNGTPTAEDPPVVDPPVEEPPVAGALTLLDIRPEPVLRLGMRLEDLAGYERHVVDARQFAADSPAGYARFVALMQAQPQVDPQAGTFGALPELEPGQIGFAMILRSDRVIQAIVLSPDPAIHVDYTP